MHSLMIFLRNWLINLFIDQLACQQIDVPDVWHWTGICYCKIDLGAILEPDGITPQAYNMTKIRNSSTWKTSLPTKMQNYLPIIIDLLSDPLPMVTSPWLMAKGSWFKARGSNLMTKNRIGRGPTQAWIPSRQFCFPEPWALSLEPRALSCKPWAMNH